MKGAVILLLTVGITFMLWVGSGTATTGSAILLNYPGATLTIDGEGPPHYGNDTIPVIPGIHRLTLLLPDRSGQWLPPILSRPIPFDEDHTLTITPDNVYSLQITTSPEGVKVLLDDQPVGKTPLALSVIRRPNMSLTLMKEGFEALSIPLDDTRLLSTHLKVTLVSTIQEAHDEDPPLIAHDGEGGPPGWLPYATLSYFVASTAIGFHSKNRADELYQNYLHTASRERMADLFDRARTMDNRARLFWVTGQIALGATVYLFFKEYKIRSRERPLPAIGMGLSQRPGGGFLLSLDYGGAGR